MHDRDHRCGALEPHPLPDPSRKNGRSGVGVCQCDAWKCLGACESPPPNAETTHGHTHTHDRHTLAAARSESKNGWDWRVPGRERDQGVEVRPRGVGKG